MDEDGVFDPVIRYFAVVVCQVLLDSTFLPDSAQPPSRHPLILNQLFLPLNAPHGPRSGILPTMTPEERLRELGFSLPIAPSPVAAYVPAVRTGDLVFVSGQIPFVDGELIARGRVPDAVDVETASRAAQNFTVNWNAFFITRRMVCWTHCSFDDHLFAHGAKRLNMPRYELPHVGSHGRAARPSTGRTARW